MARTSTHESAARTGSSKRKGKRKKSRVLTRKAADRHLLYEWSVQNPDFEIEFVDKIFRRRRGRLPLRLREDFCGTALLSTTWVESHPRREALGLDLDTETLRWARSHNVARLDGAAERVRLLETDVRSVTRPRCDVACAYNFSYFLIHPLDRLVSYFKQVRQSLRPDGMLFLDCYGGWESQQRVEEPREVEGPEGDFTYVWDQDAFNPIDNLATCYIHFEFEDGKRWKKAFTYQWRLYSLPEIRDALTMAGFAAVHIYWDRSEDEDLDDYRLAHKAENTPGWLAYVVAEK
jgi:SAM-dependent methyltransferase